MGAGRMGGGTTLIRPPPTRTTLASAAAAHRADGASALARASAPVAATARRITAAAE